MTNLKSHWIGAQDLAQNYNPSYSIAYALDHLEALLATRHIIAGNMDKKTWTEYKTMTANIAKAIEVVKYIYEVKDKQ